MTISQEWWRDPKAHFGELTENSPRLAHREDIHPAIEFMCSELALATGSKILDLCCGLGRYAVELAHKGVDVVGIDLNENYIAIARQIAEKEGLVAEFMSGDMREIPFVAQFDVIINVGTSFGFFANDVENQQVIKAVANALKPSGVFLLEMANRDYYLKNFGARDWRRCEDGSVMTIQREFDYTRGRINATFEILTDGKATTKWSSSWRAYTLAEVVAMLDEANLILSCVYGDWTRSKYDVDAKRMVVISRKVDVV